MNEILKDRDWPYDYDDSVIDDIIWSEIESSNSIDDFVCYLVHRLAHAKHREEASRRAVLIDGADNAAPIGYPRAIERIRAMAEIGDVTAMFHMGKIHAFGIATPQDLPVAIGWYERAAEKSDTRACCNLGWLYQSGDGVAVDKGKAFRLLSMGAKRGMVVALASVGMMRIVGEGCVREVESGLQMLEQAFEAGYWNAGNHLSDLYFSGRHVPLDIEVGHEWLQRVAAHGDEKSMAILGHHLVTGSHGRQEIGQGLALLQGAIDKGYLLAYLWLGGIYRDGRGMERDLAQAKYWYEKGVDAGESNCAFALASLMHDAITLPEQTH